MDEFDIKDFEDEKQKNFLQKIFKKASNTLEDIFKKYDTMGSEVAKIEMQLRKYENDVKESILTFFHASAIIKARNQKPKGDAP